MYSMYQNYGHLVDYTPSADVAVGTVVVQGQLVGVAVAPLPAGRKNSIAVKGVFDFPKATGTGTAITAGAKVYWDATNKVVTTAAGTGGVNVYVGKVVLAAADGDALVRAILAP